MPDDATDRLLRMLDLDDRGRDAFRAVTTAPDGGPPRLFGGQVAAQSLRAATRTVDTADRPPHSMHAYFIRPGKPGVPLDLDVVRARDGRSFSTRTVTASQEGETIFVCAASFHRPEEGEDWPGVERLDAAPPADDAAAPESPFSTMMPFDMRPIRGVGELGFVLHPFWIRTKGRLPDDPAVHACVIAFISDMGVVASARGGDGPFTPGAFAGASLDHALWFHRPGRPDEWLLFDVHPLTNAGARGLARGTMHAADGTLVASIVQEALLRPSGAPPMP